MRGDCSTISSNESRGIAAADAAATASADAAHGKARQKDIRDAAEGAFSIYQDVGRTDAGRVYCARSKHILFIFETETTLQREPTAAARSAGAGFFSFQVEISYGRLRKAGSGSDSWLDPSEPFRGRSLREAATKLDVFDAMHVYWRNGSDPPETRTAGELLNGERHRQVV